ncbi:sortase [Dactylosporangium sp. NPDC050588]|uniref:sortase n=1 Tax=Dactylosporangium sp. NPDC050588 TaxID=3157211 RepID=UPI0033D72BE9
MSEPERGGGGGATDGTPQHTTWVGGVSAVTVLIPPAEPAIDVRFEEPDRTDRIEKPDRVVPPPDQPASGLRIAGTGLSILAVLLVGFTLHVTLLSQLGYGRVQQTAYADFRGALAEATAPVGQIGPDGRLLPLGTPVAVLRIPALGVQQVVFEGTTAGVMQSGPGHRRDTPLPGQAGTSVIMGRNAAYGAPFAGLFRLNSGDRVEVVTGQGEFTFVVLGVRHAGDLTPAPVAPGRSRVTLMTAAGTMFFPSDVVRVDADLDNGTETVPAPPRQLGYAHLSASEKVLAGDDSAWMPLVLWGQLLLAAGLGVTWARRRWGGVQAWVVGVPVLAVIGTATSDVAVRLLPNVL